MSFIPRCLIESATPVRLEIVRITSPRGCCTYGRSMFAPVGRETPGHPDRGRRRHERQEDGPFAGTRPVRHQQGDQAQHVVPVRRERVLPAVPAETAEDRPVDGRMLHRRPRAAQGRPQARQAAQAPPPVMRTPVGAGGRMAGSRLVAAARRRQAARPVPRRPRHARVPGDRPPLGLRRPPSPWAPGAPPSTRQQEAAQAWRREDVAFPDSRTGSHLRASAGGRRSQRFRPLGGRQRDRRRMRPAHRGREEDQVPHGRDRAR